LLSVGAPDDLADAFPAGQAAGRVAAVEGRSPFGRHAVRVALGYSVEICPS
jgi:hypothetical protein